MELIEKDSAVIEGEALEVLRDRPDA